jgi:hypothetical protein
MKCRTYVEKKQAYQLKYILTCIIINWHFLRGGSFCDKEFHSFLFSLKSSSCICIRSLPVFICIHSVNWCLHLFLGHSSDRLFRCFILETVGQRKPCPFHCILNFTYCCFYSFCSSEALNLSKRYLKVHFLPYRKHTASPLQGSVSGSNRCLFKESFKTYTLYGQHAEFMPHDIDCQFVAQLYQHICWFIMFCL